MSMSLCRNTLRKLSFRPTIFSNGLKMQFYSTESKTTEPSGNASQEKSPQELLKEKDDQIEALKDLYRRALADAENVRNRIRKEVDDTAAYSIQKFAKDLLDTSDFLTMALNSVSETDRSETSSNKPLKDLYTGVALTRNELHKTFKKYGIEEFNPMGQKFDANHHQALFQSVIEGKEPGTIFSVQKTGYMILGRVLRPAHVGVVKDNE